MEKIGTAYLYDSNARKLEEIDKIKCSKVLAKYMGEDNREFRKETASGKPLEKVLSNLSYEDILNRCEFQPITKDLYCFKNRQVKTTVRLLITYLTKEKLEAALQIKSNKHTYDREYSGGGAFRRMKVSEVSKLRQDSNLTLKVPVTLKLTYSVRGGTESEPLLQLHGGERDTLLELELKSINEDEIKKVVENKVKEVIKTNMTTKYSKVYTGGWHCIDIPSNIDVELHRSNSI